MSRKCFCEACLLNALTCTINSRERVMRIYNREYYSYKSFLFYFEVLFLVIKYS